LFYGSTKQDQKDLPITAIQKNRVAKTVSPTKTKTNTMATTLRAFRPITRLSLSKPTITTTTATRTICFPARLWGLMPQRWRHQPALPSSVLRFLDDFESYRHTYNSHPPGAAAPNDGAGFFAPRFDMVEHDGIYELSGELPGMARKDMHLEFTGPRTLTVSGRVEKEHTVGDLPVEQETEGANSKDITSKGGEAGGSGTANGSRYWLQERGAGVFSRSFGFPGALDQDKTVARFENGVLTVKVPMAGRPEAGRRVKVD
jgi:HSP20 family protein